ncbi:MAG: hypothetical protein ACHQQQ_04475 [Bacteroidota bacterium]
MRRFIILFAVALFVTAIAVQAGETSTRFKKQHLKQTEENLVSVLNNNSSPSMQASAAQTIRELEWSFPEESFDSFVEPLMRIVKDETSDTQVRILAAIALDGLHSDTGDGAIESVAKGAGDKSVKTLCAALLVKSGK